MNSFSKLIEQHNSYIQDNKNLPGFPEYHLIQIKFLQQERSMHLLVTLFVVFSTLVFFLLFYFINEILFFFLFIILLVLSVFYIFHYYRLENTLIRWYYIYKDCHIKKQMQK